MPLLQCALAAWPLLQCALCPCLPCCSLTLLPPLPPPVYTAQTPHYNQWVNHFRSGLYGMVAWAALMLVVLAFGSPNASDPDTFSKNVTTIMLIGLLPIFLLMALISYYRLRWRKNHAMRAFM